MSVRWDPFRDLVTLQEHMNRLFDDSVAEHRHPDGMAGWHPPADVSESQDEFQIFLEVAGMEPDGFDVRVEKNRMSIRGERRRRPHSGQAFRQTEIMVGPFHRVFILPADVDPEGINANYRNGILEVVIPKVKGLGARSVEIKTK